MIFIPPRRLRGQKGHEMKEISRKALEKTLRKEYQEAGRFCSMNPGAVAAIMIDTDDAEIWSDVFISCNNWKEYHSPTIHKLRTVYSAEEYLDEAIDLLKDNGWEITD